MHAALQCPATRLEHDLQLAEWLYRIVGSGSMWHIRRPRRTARDERALQLAHDYRGDQPERNISLDELAAAAGVGKFRLIRLFREHTGLPPHAFQIAHRIRQVRRMLEAGDPVASVAAATGFADQSHLYRQFQRSLGMTPQEYQRRFFR